ncbi:TonB-dependent receptor [Pontixanthobacter aquaemixtae]|uniref:TonB-dependent receptor n=1 Tax=Pontixanthobacter aquaemixtae TaxID=1958940 RepID=A0A844ZR80_9SPHN|nr:TonB-dependent receptor [Pontixanthobacter aquaemixtae]MXO89822.1 TonB-dependent receptor [Pontixanthobacter aquaemixtae]
MRKALLSSTAFVMAMGMAGTAQAQENTDDTEVNDDDIIIVTATRRAQDVQDIPIAVTAVSPVQLERQGVVNVQEITQVSPSFSTSNAQTSSGSVVLRIRGVGTTSNNVGFESAVGIFIDGAYQSRPGVALSEFVDVERVEVLRGPQGTLFGRNTSAGALNITNKRPDLSEFGGFVNGTYGNRDLFSVQGAVNVPLVQDTVAMRLTGAYRQRDGFVKVIDAAGNRLGETNGADQYLIRGQIGWETDSGIKGRVIADYAQSDAPFGAAVEVLQSPVETAGLFGLVGLGATGGMAVPGTTTNRFDQSAAEASVDNLTSTANFVPSTHSDQWGLTGEIEIPIGDSADLIYIGSYREYSSEESYDSDFSGIDVFNVLPGGGTDIETMTHELRVQGEAFDGALDWLIGGYYSTEDINQQVNFGLGEDYGELIGALFFAPTGGAFGANPLTFLTDSNFFPNSPLNVPGGIDPAGTLNTNLYTQNSKSWSIFTHNTFNITDRFSATIGLRYSDETKDGSFAQGANNNALCPAILGTIAAGNVPAPLINNVFGTGCFAFTAPADLPAAAVFPLPRSFSDTFDDNELIYTGKLSYAFAAPVNIYASFTHGYKSGGFNLDSTGAAGGADPRFLSETVDAYEIGVKAKLIDNAVTLNVAAFREEFQNFQVLEFTGAQFTTFNVPKANSTGLEIETVIRPSDNLTVNGGVTYTKARYPLDCAGTQTAPNVLALCGNSLTNAPEIVAIMGASYEKDLGNYLDFFINGQIRFEDDRRTSTQAFDPSDLTNPVLVPFDIQDSNTKINLRAGIGAQDDSWAIEVFGTNITNQVTRGVTFNTVLRSGSRSAFPQEPRSYGVTLRTKF